MASQQAAGLSKGDRVELLAVPADDDYANSGLSSGMRGEVELIDSLSTVHVRWDGGGKYLGIVDRHRSLLRRIG